MSLRNRVTNLFLKRQIHGNAEIVENCKEIRNRNPRNIERLRIARKPVGYILDKPGFSYWHKLIIKPSNRYIDAEIHHFENGPVIMVSSQEWGIRKQLYNTKDIIAYKYVGRVLAQRCLESGICEMYFDGSEIIASKVQTLINELTENGISLQEPPRYYHPKATDPDRPERPWQFYE
ncbi:39S ribosomal protein L18, mitochondrial [Osmia bicornis bicornis]|uniref:39S ribosomal protein L18, mitochondrial n=1 Tax=Osmia bicornis bicornis TaxID=1437191 RepID=UPI001EAF1A37|nr:39S ribosomal protein L18, mitochondrial [Osmia bicornis bicornis]